MALQQLDNPAELEAVLTRERARLVRLCARMSGDMDCAEDLAQETLYEAWRHAQDLRDQSRLVPWLSGIARNVYLRWARSRSRDLAHRDWGTLTAGHATLNVEETPTNDWEFEVELERDELVSLLDKALALLPADTRTVLVQRYVDEAPHAEIAARMGVTIEAVKMRVQRGKLAMRRLLFTDFRDDALALGLVARDDDEWHETRIWCPLCGQCRLMGRFIHATGDFTLRCAGCFPSYCSESAINLGHRISTELFQGVKGFKPALTRLMVSGDVYFQAALRNRVAPCFDCGRLMPLQMDPPEYQPPTAIGSRGIFVRCRHCQGLADIALSGVALWRPEGRRFWGQHARIRLLPEWTTNVAGHAAIMISFESITSQVRLDMAFAPDSYRVIDAFAER